MKVLKIGDDVLQIKMSPSFMQKAACPLYLKLHYVDKVDVVKRWIRIEAERGKTGHAAIADLLQFCLDESCTLRDGVDDTMIRDAINKHLPHEIMGEAGLVFQWLRLWRDRFGIPKNIFGQEQKLALDEEFEECAWDEASYRGILDLMQVTGSHCVITDWKSQPHIIPESDLHQAIGTDIAEQFTFYAWLAWKMYPQLETFKVRLWYLRYGFYVESQRTLEDLELFEQTLMIKERKIAEIESWDPIPGKHCQYCDFIHMCPIAQDMSPSNPEIITQEQAIRAAQRITVMEALIKVDKGKLKLYVNANDNVMIGENWIYGYNHKTSTTWKPGEVDPVLRDRGYQLADVANLDVKKMRKLLKESAKTDPELAAKLEAISHEKHKTEFKGYRKGEDAVDDDESF
ncbi:MAG: PD-(D/E)XK nuclease family protein [Salinibacterium sp.]|nr:MAG: PD-(D/E)XK nuclease family protein [Salinibacterium sp.]